MSSQAKGKSAVSAGVSPFYFRLDPTKTSQYYAAGIRPGPGGTAPVITAATDAQGRPVTRVVLNTAGTTIVPLLDTDLVTPLALTGRFLIRMRANFDVANSQSTRQVGVCWNIDPVTVASLTSFAVASRGTLFDSYLNGVSENLTTFSQLAFDALTEQAYLYVDVQLSIPLTRCTYTYGSAQATRDNFQQRRKTALQTAGKSGVGLFFAGTTGTTDISELTIYKPDYLW